MPFTDTTFEVFSQFGLAGMVLAVLFLIFYFGVRTLKTLSQEQSADRNAAEDRWRDTFISVADQADRRQNETNIILRDLTATVRVLESKTRNG